MHCCTWQLLASITMPTLVVNDRSLTSVPAVTYRGSLSSLVRQLNSKLQHWVQHVIDTETQKCVHAALPRPSILCLTTVLRQGLCNHNRRYQSASSSHPGMYLATHHSSGTLEDWSVYTSRSNVPAAEYWHSKACNSVLHVGSIGTIVHATPFSAAVGSRAT